MKEEEFKEIKYISYPNTVIDSERSFCGNTMNDWKFEKVTENGEMAEITWIDVYKDGKKVAHIKQSVCDIYFS